MSLGIRPLTEIGKLDGVVRRAAGREVAVELLAGMTVPASQLKATRR